MLPKKGRTFPDGSKLYAAAVARALRRELGDTHRAVKIVMRWTGAGERTVKNWFAGINGPSGEHLIDLIRHSDELLQVFLILAGREQTIAAKKLFEMRDKLSEMLSLIRALIEDKR